MTTILQRYNRTELTNDAERYLYGPTYSHPVHNDPIHKTYRNVHVFFWAKSKDPSLYPTPCPNPTPPLFLISYVYPCCLSLLFSCFHIFSRGQRLSFLCFYIIDVFTTCFPKAVLGLVILHISSWWLDWRSWSSRRCWKAAGRRWNSWLLTMILETGSMLDEKKKRRFPHTHTHAHVDTYTHTYIHTYKYTHTYIHTHIQRYTHTGTRTDTQTQTDTPTTQTQRQTQTDRHRHIHTLIYCIFFVMLRWHCH